jgi:hypothetical protein
MTSNGWEWKASKQGWFTNLLQSARLWSPHRSLRIDVDDVRGALDEAILRKANWLYHPCSAPLINRPKQNQAAADFAFLSWLALNIPDLDTLVIYLPEGFSRWTPAGGEFVKPGFVRFRHLRHVGKRDWPFSISLDLRCRSVGYPTESSWAERPAASGDEEPLPESVLGEIRSSIRALAILQERLPNCNSWISYATSVVIPLATQLDGRVRSWSGKWLPGAIHTDLAYGELQILEAMVHESAHNQLYLLEIEGPLVDPTNQELHISPLRRDLRPLRGILLGYHALVFICQFYKDLIDLKVFERKVCEGELDRSLGKLKNARALIQDHQTGLTASGRAFFEEIEAF